jgi:hypothetical protein
VQARFWEGAAQAYHRNVARRRFPTLPDLLRKYQHKLLAAALLYIRASALTDWCLKIKKLNIFGNIVGYFIKKMYNICAGQYFEIKLDNK